MKRSISLLVSLLIVSALLISSAAFSAEKAKVAPKRAAAPAATKQQQTEQTPTDSEYQYTYDQRRKALHNDTGYISVLAGPSMANNNIGTHLGFAVRAGGMLSSQVALGFYGQYTQLASGSGTDADTGLSASGSVSETALMAAFDYWLVPNHEIYLGAKAGVGIMTASVSANLSGSSFSASASQSNFAFGPAFGAFFPVGSFKLGGEVNYLMFTTSGSMLALVNVLGGATFNF